MFNITIFIIRLTSFCPILIFKFIIFTNYSILENLEKTIYGCVANVDSNELSKGNEKQLLALIFFLKLKSKTEKSQFINGYNPFIFYEKEKFKDVNIKEVNAREYVKKISAEWKKMSEKRI